MKVIAVMSTKGGVGKTKVCGGLARSLKLKGYAVGLLDGDWVAPTLQVEMGMSDQAKMTLNNGVGDVIQPVISPEGFPIVSSAFIFPPDQAILMDEESKIKDILELTKPGVINWGEIDYLIMDTPPSTEKFMQQALEIQQLHGVVIVSQPAIASVTDVLRTVSLMRDLQVPVLGLVGNQVYVECPNDGTKIFLYELNEEDLREFCQKQGIHFLGSIPHILPGTGKVMLNGIAESIISITPTLLKKSFTSVLPYKILIAIARKKQEQQTGSQG